MAVSKRTRFEVFKRDLFTCQYCGRRPPTVVLEVDHVIPRADDGSDAQDNLLTSCFDCNRGKSDISLGAVPETVARQIERKREAAAQFKALSDFLMEQRDSENGIVERLGIEWCNRFCTLKDRGKYIPAEDRLQSIRVFVRRLPEADILDAIFVAASKFPALGVGEPRDAFRYFCGVCWRRIKIAEGNADG